MIEHGISHLLPTYARVDLAFERIGFRFAYIQSESSDTISGQKVELNQTLQVLSVFVPFG